MSNSLLTVQQLKAIKTDLWWGKSREAIAEEHGCAVQTIHSIVYGKRHSEIPWPDESLGKMSNERMLMILQARLRVKEATTKFTFARIKAALKEAEAAP